MKKLIIGIIAVAALGLACVYFCCPPDCCKSSTECKAKTQETSANQTTYKMAN